MVLVAPVPCSGRPPRVTRRRIVARGTRSWRCCAVTPPTRPCFDPGLAGGLRAWLEDAAYDVVAARGDHAPPLFLGPRQLLGSARTEWRRRRGRGGDGDRADRLLLSHLVHALLRQLVHTGEIDDPLADALDALRAGGDDAEVRHDRVAARSGTGRPGGDARAARPEPDRAGPAVRPGLDAADQRPRRHPAGRRQDRPARDLRPRRRTTPAGAPRRCARSDCPPAVRGPRSGVRCTTCRCSRPSGAALPRSGWRCWSPPSGRYGVEDVREEHLRAIASHIAAWLARAGTGTWITGSWTRWWQPVPAVDATSLAVRPRRGEVEVGGPGRPARRSGPLPRHRPRGAHRLLRHDDADDPGHAEPFAWSARTARRSIGVAAVRLLVGGGGTVAARGGAVPVGRVLPLGARRQLVAPRSSTAGSTASRRPAAPPSAPRP